MDPQNPEQTIYNAYSYKPLGYLDRWKRSEGHKWGVSTLTKIMENDILAKQKEQLEKQKAKIAETKAKLSEKKEALKTQLADNKIV